MILITGATGTNGSEITKQLLAQGSKVRIIVRDSQKAASLQSLGAEIVEGSFSDIDSLKNALNGVEKALMLSPLAAEMVQFQKNFIEAAKSQNIQQLVKFSGMGASVEAPIEIARLHGQAEQMVEASGIPFTHL
ncbi:MAG: NmrA family NAD(P)-binding protein, partial [Crocosphaera sp.]|nr:NmrA family NAD(P)-binding protein [Crocosphaera sp.]